MTNFWLLEKINKIDKLLASLKKKRTHIIKSKNEKGEVITDTKHKGSYTITMDNYITIKQTTEKEKINSQKHKYPKSKSKGNKIMNRPITSNETESVILKPPTRSRMRCLQR